MNNDQLISIDDASLDQVAGGGWTLSFTIPTPGEVIEEAVEAVDGVVDAVEDGVGGLLGLFGFSIG